MKYSMFIGRWQPWHNGHRWLIDQRLQEGKNVLICVREVSKDDKNPYDPAEVKVNVENELQDLIDSKKVKVIIIPDIESVNYGRGVGYDIIEHVPPSDISKISATKIRKNYLVNKDSISFVSTTAVPFLLTTIDAAAFAILAASSTSPNFAYAKEKEAITVSPAPVTSGLSTACA